ncbi:MAG: hypothetical protein AB8E82_19950 [Aureispira sp.]
MAIELKDLDAKADLLATGLGIDSANTKLLLELLKSKRVTKPELKFKAGAAKLKIAGKQPFVYVREEKGAFMFLGLDLPMMKKHVEPKLKAVTKALKKAKESEKESLELQEAFYTALFDRVKKKKLVATSGKLLVKNLDPTSKECFMSLEGKVEGEDKGSLEQIFADTNYTAKNGEILRLYNPNSSTVSDDETETTEGNQGTTTEDTATLEANKAKRSTQMGQMKDGIDKMDQVKGKAPQDKLNANIAKYETALSKLIEDAKKDGVVDDEEQAQIDELQTLLNELKEAVSQRSDKKVTTEARAKINKNINKVSDRLDAIVQALNL